MHDGTQDTFLDVTNTSVSPVFHGVKSPQPPPFKIRSPIRLSLRRVGGVVKFSDLNDDDCLWLWRWLTLISVKPGTDGEDGLV